MKPVYYAQNAPAWGSLPYTIDGDKNETIGKSGCGPTSMAMILATWVNPKITPIEMCKLSIELKDRTANNGTEWEFFGHVATKYELCMKQTSSIKEAIEGLKDGAYVICSMGPGYFTKGGHFILAYKYEDGNIYVNDPASTIRTQASTNIFQRECKQYFIFTNPDISIEQAIDILVGKKIFADKGHWIEKAKEIKYLDVVFKNMAKYIKKG